MMGPDFMKGLEFTIQIRGFSEGLREDVDGDEKLVELRSLPRARADEVGVVVVQARDAVQQDAYAARAVQRVDTLVPERPLDVLRDRRDDNREDCHARLRRCHKTTWGTLGTNMRDSGYSECSQGCERGRPGLPGLPRKTTAQRHRNSRRIRKRKSQ